LPTLPLPALVAPTLLKSQRQFWSAITPSLLAARPKCSRIDHVWGGDLTIGYNASNTDIERPDRLHISDEQFHELRDSHRQFKAHLEQARYELPFVPGTKGIVTTAGGTYLPVAVVSIEMLRRTGCKLPVEVYLATADEWDSEICDVLLPSLSARCLILDDILSHGPSKSDDMPIEKYQYKIMSILFSSFEEVLFLDSDSFPIIDPTDLFSWDLYRTTGMVRWPDFWFPSESPSFFFIADISAPRLYERGSTESGQLLYHKPRHTNSLLLALYYNVYGPDYYYVLQAQGNAGEGDKETFLWSQVVFNEPFYSVLQRIQPIGYMDTNGEWRGSAMAQFDPRNDGAFVEYAVNHTGNSDSTKFPPLFLHVNFPKINPALIFKESSFGVTGPTKDSDGRVRRIWIEDPELAVEYFGFDVEKRLWTVVKDIACQWEGKFKSWEKLDDVCKNASEYWDEVFGRKSLD
jgi:alpha 1,2-mannosyltransferase